MLPVQSALIIPTDQEYEEDKTATEKATQELGDVLAQENHPFCALPADISLAGIVFRLNLKELIALRGVSQASRSIADNLCVKREIVCENWGFGVQQWNALLGKVTNPPLPLSCVERVFAKIIVQDPYITQSAADLFPLAEDDKVYHKSFFVFQNYTFYFTPEKVNEQEYTLEHLNSLLQGSKTKLEMDVFLEDEIEARPSGRAHWALMRKTVEQVERKCLIKGKNTIKLTDSTPSERLKAENLQQGDEIGSPLSVTTGIALMHLISDKVIPVPVKSTDNVKICVKKGEVSVKPIFSSSDKDLPILPILRV